VSISWYGDVITMYDREPKTLQSNTRDGIRRLDTPAQ
jgi:hypothetical protein